MKQYVVQLSLAREGWGPTGKRWQDTAGPFRDRAAAERALVGALQSGVASGGDIIEHEVDESDES